MRHSGENSRQNILDAALRLFSERGYTGVGISEIVQAAGVTKPTLYHFFGSKDGLFTEILEENYGRLNALLTAVCRYEPRPDDYYRDVYPVLLEVATTYFGFARARPEFYLMCLALTFAPPTSPQARLSEPLHAVQYTILAELFRQFSAVHRNLRGKEFGSAIWFLSMVNAHIAFWHRGRGELTEAEAGQIVTQFLHGVFS